MQQCGPTEVADSAASKTQVQELLFEVLDTLLCAVLVVYSVYIGYSHTQRVINGEGMLSRGHAPSKGGKPGVRV